VDGRAGNPRRPSLLAGERGHDGVDWDCVERLDGFGGMRLEQQNALVTDDGCEILTAAVAREELERNQGTRPRTTTAAGIVVKLAQSASGRRRQRCERIAIQPCTQQDLW
jgi:hypothetical protein